MNQQTKKYLKHGRIANESIPIRQLARSLVANQSDLYHAVFAIADYVHHNIEYSLQSSINNRRRAKGGGRTSNNIQSASSVLSSRYGKCDEMTALFVSLVRSLGIPARFITGYAYSNSKLFDEDWGGHTWAEVFFPGSGWAPFDVSYGQFGYVDAGHIQLSVTHDAECQSVQFEFSGVDFQPVINELKTNVNPVNTIGDGRQQKPIDFVLDVQAPEVGFGSTAVVVATIRNKSNHYVSTQLNLVKGKDITLVNNDVFMNILLDLGEVREIPYFFIMDKKYNSGFAYEYPFLLKSRWSSRDGRTQIKVRDGAPMYYAKQ